MTESSNIKCEQLRNPPGSNPILIGPYNIAKMDEDIKKLQSCATNLIMQSQANTTLIDRLDIRANSLYDIGTGIQANVASVRKHVEAIEGEVGSWSAPFKHGIISFRSEIGEVKREITVGLSGLNEMLRDEETTRFNDIKTMGNVIKMQRKVIDELRNELQQQRDLLNSFHQELSDIHAEIRSSNMKVEKSAQSLAQEFKKRAVPTLDARIYREGECSKCKKDHSRCYCDDD